MDDLGTVGYGPVVLVWRHSRLTDYALVAEKLQSKLLPGTQVFGFYSPFSDPIGYSIYQMVLWPPLQQDESPSQEWRIKLQEVVTELTELERLNLETHLKDSTQGESPSKRDQSYSQNQWAVYDCGDGGDPSQTVKDFILHLQKVVSEKTGIVLFGEIAFEYEVDGQRWREEYSAIPAGGYVSSVRRV